MEFPCNDLTFVFKVFADPEMRLGKESLAGQAKWRFETLIRQKGLAQRLPPAPIDASLYLGFCLFALSRGPCVCMYKRPN